MLYNGVQIRDGKAMLMLAPHSKKSGTQCLGTPLVMLQEMEWLRQETSLHADLDVGFGYTVGTQDAKQASIVPVYTPPKFAHTFCGLCTRVADDALKQWLKTVCEIGRTQHVADTLYTSTMAKNTEEDEVKTMLVKVQFEGGYARMELKSCAIIASTSNDCLIVKDVALQVVYEADVPTKKPATTCEAKFVQTLQNTVIREEARNTESPFFRLKQVAIAQALVNFAAAKKARYNFDGASFSSVIDPCTIIEYSSQERKLSIWHAVEIGVGVAAMVEFENDYFQKERSSRILIKRKKEMEYETFVLRQDQSVNGLSFFGHCTVTQPECPSGGIVLPSRIPFQPTSHPGFLKALKNTSTCYDNALLHATTSVGQHVDLLLNMLQAAPPAYASFVTTPLFHEKFDMSKVLYDQQVHFQRIWEHKHQEAIQNFPRPYSKIAPHIPLPKSGWRDLSMGRVFLEFSKDPSANLIVDIAVLEAQHGTEIRNRVPQYAPVKAATIPTNTFRECVTCIQKTTGSLGIKDFHLRTNVVNDRLHSILSRSYPYNGCDTYLVSWDNQRARYKLQEWNAMTGQSEGVWQIDGKQVTFVRNAQRALSYAAKGSVLLSATSDAIHLAQEVEISYASKDFTNTKAEVARIAGGWSGAWAGAKIGAVAGSKFPGNIVVKFLVSASGTIVGSYIGYQFGSQACEDMFYKTLEQNSFFQDGID